MMTFDGRYVATCLLALGCWQSILVLITGLKYRGSIALVFLVDRCDIKVNVTAVKLEKGILRE